MHSLMHIAPELDRESFELANSRLKLRDGLKFVMQHSDGETTYVLQDPVTSHVHEIGIAQYGLISGFDGHWTLGAIAQQLASQMPGAALSSQQAEQTARYLLDHQLAYAVDGLGNRIESTHRLSEQRSRIDAQRKAENANPLFVKIRLADPSCLLDKLTSIFGSVFSRTGVISILMLIGVAGMQLWQNSDAVIQSLRGIADPASAFWLALIFVVLKIVHELGHGIACHRLGGNVTETGVVFILFVPIPYVDVTSAWGFSRRRERMLVSAAGMLIEMAFASIAAIMWSLSHDPILRFHLMNVVLMGTLTTLLFNANFLMRFDGYFLLSDMIGIPNLAPSSRACVSAYARHYLLGTSLNLSAHDRRHRGILIVYGVASMIWRVIVCVGLALVASELFFGFGVLLAAASVLVWFGRPSLKLIVSLMADTVEAARSRRVLAVRTLPALAAFLLLLCIVPWPWQPSAPAIVQHRDSQIVRTKTDGFIREILVKDGQWLEPGEIIVRLQNTTLDAELKIAEARLASSEIRMRQELVAGHIASHQAEAAVHQSLRTRLDELRHRQQECEVRADIAGLVVAPELDNQIGLYCDAGHELCRVINENKKELLVSISQQDMSAYRERIGDRLIFRFGSGNAIPVSFASVEPNAVTRTDPRLTAEGGGKLAQRDVDNELQLVEPRFQAIAGLSFEQAQRLTAGMTGSVRLQDHRQSVAAHVYQTIFQ
jgi:putative peptide zinc metalloprotease protein